MDIHSKAPMVQISLRIPKDWRDLVKAISVEKSVKDSDVYRKMIEDFFSQYRSTKEHEKDSK